jgi:outer membrane protein TolC
MKRFYQTLLALALPVALHAQEPQALSQQDAIDFALQNNYSVRNARLDFATQLAKNSEITGLALPQVSAKNEFTYYAKPIVSFLPAQILDRNAPEGQFVPVTFSPTYQNTLSASGSQILFDGTVFVALQARNTLVELAKLGIKASEEDVRINVTRAYQALVVGHRQFRILGNSIASARAISRDLEAMRKAGFVEKIDVDRSQVQINNLMADSLRISNALLLGEQLLKFNMGMNVNTPVLLTDTSLDAVLPAATALLTENVDYNQRTLYKQLETGLKLNEFDLKRYKYQGLPSLAAFGSAAYTYGNNSFSEITKPKNYVFYALTGVQLNVPIFSGRRRYFQVRQAELAVQKSRNMLDNMRQIIDLDYAQGKATLRNSILTLENQSRNLELANSVLDLAQRKYKEGVGSNVEVTQAQTAVQQAQNSYFTSLLDVINSNINLRRALGQFK